MIDDLGQGGHTVGLRSRAWVGPSLTALDRKAITRAWTGRRIGTFPPATFELGHRSVARAAEELGVSPALLEEAVDEPQLRSAVVRPRDDVAQCGAANL